jgi:hypothetical protein
MTIFHTITVIENHNFLPSSQIILIDDYGTLYENPKFRMNLYQLDDLVTYGSIKKSEINEITKKLMIDPEIKNFVSITPENLIAKFPNDKELQKKMIPFWRDKKIDQVIK